MRSTLVWSAASVCHRPILDHCRTCLAVREDQRLHYILVFAGKRTPSFIAYRIFRDGGTYEDFSNNYFDAQRKRPWRRRATYVRKGGVGYFFSAYDFHADVLVGGYYWSDAVPTGYVGSAGLQPN